MKREGKVASKFKVEALSNLKVCYHAKTEVQIFIVSQVKEEERKK